MKEDEKQIYDEDETVEINVEELTEVQGGIDDIHMKDSCGLGCFVGAGYGPVMP